VNLHSLHLETHFIKMLVCSHILEFIELDLDLYSTFNLLVEAFIGYFDFVRSRIEKNYFDFMNFHFNRLDLEICLEKKPHHLR